MTTPITPTSQPAQELLDAWKAAADAVVNYVDGVKNGIPPDKQQFADLISEVDKARVACELSISSNKPTRE